MFTEDTILSCADANAAPSSAVTQCNLVVISLHISWFRDFNVTQSVAKK